MAALSSILPLDTGPLNQLGTFNYQVSTLSNEQFKMADLSSLLPLDTGQLNQLGTFNYQVSTFPFHAITWL
jgi:hypothetical protein